MVQQVEVRSFGLRLPHSTCHLAADRVVPRRMLQLLLLLLLYCSRFADGSWWRIADLSLDPAHFHRDNRSYELCGDTTFFTDHQRDACYNNPELLKVIVHAANTAKYECQTYFQNYRWNCSAKRGSSIHYGNFDDKGNRETAYLSAINSASLTWTITRFCTKGELTTCQCDRIIRSKHSNKWTWGGCSEDIKYGLKQSRSFTDPQENKTTSFGLMNLHNNEAARRVHITLKDGESLQMSRNVRIMYDTCLLATTTAHEADRRHARFDVRCSGTSKAS